MGDPKRKHKKYSRPKQLFDKVRIDEENSLLKKYGLKSKREIWKADSAVSKFRARAKALIVESQEEQQKFFNKLINLGMLKDGDTLDDVLALTKEKLLERRLQTIVHKLNLAKTAKESRQLIAHRKVMVNNKVIDAPSYVVKTGEENSITLKKKIKKEKPQESIQIIEPELETPGKPAEPIGAQ